MEFRDLKQQYQTLKPAIDKAVSQVLEEGNFISGSQVTVLEEKLAEYVGVKHCISCANGTDAISLALMALGIGTGDAVFVPDFTFFATGEAPALKGAVPVFVDIEESSFNMSPEALAAAIEFVLFEGKYKPRLIITVDLFGQPANYPAIREIADKYHLQILEDAAQGFGGSMGGKRACSLGDISCTSFFPAKPLGCFGDGGAVFTNHEKWAEYIRSCRVHGKGKNKYDNIRIGMNSRLDTLQAAILLVKFEAFQEYELDRVNQAAGWYQEELYGMVKIPDVRKGFYSSWAQYSIMLDSQEQRNLLKRYLAGRGIPSMVYYPKALHELEAFKDVKTVKTECRVTESVCRRILSLPIHPYMEKETVKEISYEIKKFLND